MRVLVSLKSTQKQPPEMFYKKAALKNFVIFTGKNLCWSHFLIKLQASRPETLLKKDSNTVFSCEYCEIFKSTCFEEHLPPAASVNYFVKLINDRYSVQNKISLFSNFQNPPDMSKIFE